MVNCSFCGTEIAKGTGLLFVRKEGSANYFCSHKCERNLVHLKRNPVNVKWTQTYHRDKAGMLKTQEKRKEKAEKAEKK